MRVHILDDWSDQLRGLPAMRLLDRHEVTIWTDAPSDEAALAQRLRDAQALVLFRERRAIGAGLLARLPGLQLISGRGAWPHVDLAACRAHGVAFSAHRGAERPNRAAAELTFALILAAMRDLAGHGNGLRAGQWQAGALGRGLYGRCLGVYGAGRIGRLVAQYAEAFGMRVIFWGSDARLAALRAEGAPVAESRAAFFGQADVVSLHLRLVEETRAIVTQADFAAMRPGALFVNTARDALVAPGALLAGLSAGRPGWAALDVFAQEPADPAQDALLRHPRVIATPHIGFVTEDELDHQFAEAFAQVNAFAEGRPIHLVVPPPGYVADRGAGA